MLQMTVRNLVYALVKQELQGKGREGEAMYFNFDVRLSYRDPDKEHRASRGVHALYHCKPSNGRYVTVFTAITDNCFAKIGEVENWEHASTHDTCWRDVALYSNVYFRMAEAINNQLVNDGMAPVAPIDMNQSVWIRENMFSWVPVEVTKEPGKHLRTVKLL